MKSITCKCINLMTNHMLETILSPHILCLYGMDERVGTLGSKHRVI